MQLHIHVDDKFKN